MIPPERDSRIKTYDTLARSGKLPHRPIGPFDLLADATTPKSFLFGAPAGTHPLPACGRVAANTSSWRVAHQAR